MLGWPSKFKGDIVHTEWRRKANTGTNHIEDVFLNPDQHSPVAAILIRQSRDGEGRESFSIGVIGKSDEAGDDIRQRLDKYGLRGATTGTSAETTQKLGELGIPLNSSGMFDHFELYTDHGLSPEAEDVQLTQRRQRVMKALSDTSLISNNPAVRKAMRDKIGESFSSLQPGGKASRII